MTTARKIRTRSRRLLCACAWVGLACWFPAGCLISPEIATCSRRRTVCVFRGAGREPRGHPGRRRLGVGPVVVGQAGRCHCPCGRVCGLVGWLVVGVRSAGWVVSAVFESERFLARRVATLIRSPRRSDRKRANSLGSVVGNWRRGRMGDSALLSAARSEGMPCVS